MNNLEVENQITNDVSIENKQRNFLQTNIGKAVNTGLNIGLRYILPDVIEDQVIEIKDSWLDGLINYLLFFIRLNWNNSD